jgi:hypothetical protein
MGNFSRDPRARVADSIAKHYVAIPLQQAVPVLDADWNEAENLRRHQHETLGARFIGSGVPVGDDGFRIMAANTDNDFSVRRGAILVDGKLVVNDADTTYSAQPNASLAPPLATPGADTTLIAFLDTWEREVDSEEDPALVDNRIGVETCLRLKTEWVVRVTPGVNPQALPAPPAGHHFSLLALLRRPANSARITFAMIGDLRRLHLTLAESTKAPLELYGAAGNLIFTLDNFADMLDTTERAYFDILRSDLFMASNFATATLLEVATMSAIFHEVMQTAISASLQAKIRNLDNADGLTVLRNLYLVQDHFVNVVTPMAAGVATRATTSSLMSRLRQLLDGAVGTPGLRPPAFTNPDLDAAIRAQQEINREMGNRTQILPHGRLEVRFVSGPAPGVTITSPGTFRYQFTVTYVRTIPGPAQTETFDVLPSLNPPGWTAAHAGTPPNRITLSTDGETTVPIDVTIPPATLVTSATLSLQVRSRLNPTEMDTTNSEVAVTVGSGGAQPRVVHVDLMSPAVNLATGAIDVGRGGPAGMAGKAANLKFKFTFDQIVGTPVEFTVSFVAAPTDAFVPLIPVTVLLGGAQGGSKESLFAFAASETAVNDTLGTLTVRIAKTSDANVFDEKVIKLRVNKS